MTDPLMAAAMKLAPSMDALAAIGARARIGSDGTEVDPRIRDLLDRIVAQVVGAEEPVGTEDPVGTGGSAMDGSAAGDSDAAVLGLAEALLSLGLDLVRHPERAMGWEHTDVALLQSIGRLSGAIAGAIESAGRVEPRLGHVVHREDGVFLDVGTGTGWLAIAMARTFPNLRIVGVDVFEPALELARRNVVDEGLDDRIELRLQDASQLDDVDAYDAVWIALPFIPGPIVPAVLDAARRSLRHGGVVLPGTFDRPPDRLARMLVELRTLRSGGHPWSPTELCDLLSERGFESARHLPRTWPVPVELYLAEVAAAASR
ncbi:MAG TPA: class I SAM-dependent methyltransferase [Microthrixaceae bacterium]|nr:class I SAM-dependent methyltransferase [Microthrixaceae bacterium]